MSKIALASTFLLLIHLSNQHNLVEPLRCYDCSGPLGTNADCVSLTHIQPTECSQNNVCAGYVIKNPDTEILHRSCAPEDICAVVNLEYENNPRVTVKECRVCDQDECNSANLTTSAFILSLLMLAMPQLL
ncbi:uncharacterized protein BDFB_010534 [Asbolus verrucosus]|uniref:Protein sleepless n=1 Tax=Asbolus verrucosus TaxID=1661398 RepID=A0A482VCD4_ASBVE|nr:uncharacterized protein BDFB_010534 [Asbolus verrucosus]